MSPKSGSETSQINCKKCVQRAASSALRPFIYLFIYLLDFSPHLQESLKEQTLESDLLKSLFIHILVFKHRFINATHLLVLA